MFLTGSVAAASGGEGEGGGGSSVSRWTGSATPECLEKEPFSFLRLNCFSHFTSVFSCFRVASL